MGLAIVEDGSSVPHHEGHILDGSFGYGGPGPTPQALQVHLHPPSDGPKSGSHTMAHQLLELKHAH
jgi:hypothetical protein